MFIFHVFSFIKVILTNSTSVGRQRLSSRSVSIAHNQNVISSIRTGAEGILENTAWPQNNLRIVTGSLIGRATIEVPTGELVNRVGTCNWESTCLGTAFSLGINPNIFGEDLVGGVWEGVETVNDGSIKLRFTSSDIKWFNVESRRSAGNRCRWGEGSGSADGGEEGDGKLHGCCYC